MFSCLWQIWDWIDPGKMDKIQKTQPFENTASSIQNQDISHNETVSQQLHQHSSTNHFYPMIHQHAQAYNKGYGQPMQAPLLLNISNQHIIQTTAHRHFQYYPQYGVNINQNDFPHQHIPRHVNHQPQSNISNPTPPPVPAISSSNVQAPSHDEHVQKVAPAEVLKQEPSKEGSAKKLTPAKVKPKEGDKIQLRSPPAKRPPNSPVTMQGWLHKQGSEGLMLWKKRWFVLSEYCLFYYKGLQEDKVLGSILLPSYKVSICGPEDKVNRKFAFKCEHANMRTYILAADSQELMNKWVHVLSMACNLQSNIEPPKDQKIPQNNTSEPNSFKSNTPSGQSSSTYGNQLNTSARSNPIHHHTPSNTTDLSNSSQQELNQYNQPLYANAPPKPRRMTDGYCSPGPEILERYPSYQMSHSGAKSPVDMYGRHVIKPPEQIYNERIFLGPPNVDRRTPDTYARSNMSKYRNPTDYEDIYTDHGIYKRPLSPVAPDSMLKKGYPTVNVGYPAVKGYAPPPLELLRPQYPEPVLMRKSMAQTISRPHSADFLEYKPQKLESNPSATPVSQHSRPKSSLDINMYSKDCDTASRSNYFLNTVDRHNDKDYFYSQEKYAEKMRKSAQYLQKMPVKYQPVDPSQRKYREKYELEIANTYAYSQPFRDQQVPNLQPVRSRSALSEGSLLCAQDVEDDSISREYPLRHEHDLHLSNRNLAQDQFTRSASARLTQSGTFEETVTTRMEGERKREESMKRLLEWKQRMLQSPLNRKAQAQATRGYPVGKENSYSSYQSFASGDKKQKKSTITNRRSVHNLVQYTSYSSDDEASGSISINTRDSTLGRDTFPRGMTPKRSETPNSQNVQSRSTTNLDKSTIRSYDKNIANYPSQWINQSNQQICDREQDFRASQNDITSKSNVSAGELLERTHEELVLLLIQLRRQQAQTFQAIESCYNEIDSLQIHMHNMDQVKRMENLQKLERIKQNLLELEKQYEKRKPLVNLVDNMVKLGSLYRNSNERPDTSRHLRERLEFNQHIQERRLLAEERRDWNRIEPSHIQLQEKVRQLYQLDSLIQEESRNLHNLQRDKGDIERALGGLRNKLQKGLNTPEEIDQARRQQYILENELSRVHLMLAHNSKKLEETVAGNARLEQELLVLKQKLQASRQQRSSPQFSNAGDSLPYFTGSSQVLESDLEKVQKKIGDLQKQRDELSLQVRQLTDRSNTPHLQQAKISFSSDSQCNNANKKKPISSWRETDLDTMNSIDHGYDSYSSTSTTPLFINTDMKLYSGDAHDRSMKTSDSTSDDTALSSNPLEKPEIKTVRIVKRESERRQRDREKTFNGKCDPLVEEDSSEGSSVLFRPTSLPQKLPVSYEHNSLPSRGTRNKAAELSPVFKSEAARQIITEMSTKSKSPSAQNQRRAIPKERRRHHTAPHDNLVFLGNLEGRRARDDLDIERALRQRIDAPDLVRSTLSNKELKYNEETIDSILSTPNKILIPERYIPEQLPQPNTSRESKRKKKVESIKKMLSDTAIISAPTTSSAHTDEQSLDKKPSPSGKFQSAPTISEEKKQREHLLQLNQILAKQVMEMSKVVAVKNLTALKLNPQPVSTEEDDSSPIAPLPLYQQRENFYS
ncbi:uncharacterized protein LOC126748184 isoform X5 [Anthonomus grandis grandis]|uniref:uncharacterized protein LOC126748184 isoform X5 n=1 Tax=Anthonomus grandis grandis TaxID=2921223 RepID=UPI002165072C|nr:uncharacterized protein LOC126748184 isoform X5 [Anthonomus grandis grandis]